MATAVYLVSGIPYELRNTDIIIILFFASLLVCPAVFILVYTLFILVYQPQL